MLEKVNIVAALIDKLNTILGIISFFLIIQINKKIKFEKDSYRLTQEKNKVLGQLKFYLTTMKVEAKYEKQFKHQLRDYLIDISSKYSVIDKNEKKIINKINKNLFKDTDDAYIIVRRNLGILISDIERNY